MEIRDRTYNLAIRDDKYCGTDLVALLVGLLFLFALLPSASGQSASLSLSSASAAEGSATSLALRLTSQGGSPAAVQWTFGLPSRISGFTLTPGPALISASKSMTCFGAVNAYKCVASGINRDLLPDGVVANLVVSVGTEAGISPVSVRDGLGASVDGTAIPISTMDGLLTVLPPDPACTYTFGTSGVSLTNPVPPAGPPLSATGSVMLSPSSTCQGPWTASSSAAWLMITSGGNGSGNAAATIGFTAFSNALSTPRSATITVAGSQFLVSQPGSEAPLRNRQVVGLYQALLGRDPDSGGYAFWTGTGLQLNQMVDEFLTSPEGLSTDFLVLAIYQAVLGRAPSFDEWLAAVNGMRHGSQTAGQLTSVLLSSSEYASKFGLPVNNSNVVNQLYINASPWSPASSSSRAGTRRPRRSGPSIGLGSTPCMSA